MDEFSRPVTLEDLKLLLRSLHEHGADYLLIGDYALAAHGYQRATTDIDVVVPATSQAGQRVKDALLRQYAETIELDGIPVNTINLEGLLLTKKTMRDKDKADRIIIERALEVSRLQTGER